MTVILRPNQIEMADAVENAYRQGIQKPLADSCVGSGKSLGMAELTRRAYERGERSIILAHRESLVAQNASAAQRLGLRVGVNAVKLGERTWRAPVISAMIQSVWKNASSFGPVQNILTDEAHLIPHSDAGMYREFLRYFGYARQPGFSGTVFRLQGGSLVEGEAAPFQKVVFTYSIIDGIRDGYLVPAFSAPAMDKIDPTQLKRNNVGEYTGSSQDAQMLALMDSHIMQMKLGGADRRAWLIFEASKKAVKAMTERLNAWGISAAYIIAETSAEERKRIYEAFSKGRLRALVNIDTLTTGFDDPRIDLVCMRRKTMSKGLYIQIAGRGLRTIGGTIESSIAAGKADCIFFDFAGNIDEHGPLDFIKVKKTTFKLVTCEECSARVPAAAMTCWQCDAPMTKLCPGCLGTVEKGVTECPICNHDMRTFKEEGGGPRAGPKLLATPTGAALIAAFRPALGLEGGWVPIRKAYDKEGQTYVLDEEGQPYPLPVDMAHHAAEARWIRADSDGRVSLMKPNGGSRTTVVQVANGMAIVVPKPPQLIGGNAA